MAEQDAMAESLPARLVVTLEGDESSLDLLNVAAGLALRLDRELLALFIQDEPWLAASDLPVMRVVSVSGSFLRFDANAAHRLLQLQAERARAALHAMAVRHHLRASFRSIPVTALAPLLRPGDVLATGPRPRHWLRREDAAPPPPCPTILIGRGPGPILIVYEGGPESLAIGRRLAIDDDLPLVLLAVQSGLATAAERAEEARRRLGTLPIGRLAVLTVESDDPQRLAPAIRAWRPAIVIADTCGTETRLRAVVQALSTPAP